MHTTRFYYLVLLSTFFSFVSADGYKWVILTNVEEERPSQLVECRGTAYSIWAPKCTFVECLHEVAPPFPMWSSQEETLTFLNMLPELSSIEEQKAATVAFINKEVKYHFPKYGSLGKDFLRKWLLFGIYKNLLSMSVIPRRERIDLYALYHAIKKAFDEDITTS